MLPDGRVFEQWLRAVPGFAGARVTAVAIADGGASNVTCRVALADAPAPAVGLRVQRERGIFEPYDVVREGEVVRCLADSGVPVPRVLGSEPSGDVLGAPFIAMEWVDAPHMGMAPGANYGAFVAMVARIHALDWKQLGLGFLGIPDSARAALLGELAVIEQRRQRFAGADERLLEEAHELLVASVPDDGRVAFCQGDINVFNYLFRDGEVAAVVDWEQARLSDPRSDAGQLLALSNLKGMPFGPADEQPFVLAYGAATGEPLRGMAWFRARWLWELGVIYHGWRAFNHSDPWYTHEMLADTLRAAMDELAHG